MQKKWISLGLMSGTSGDGIDASIIKSNGTNHTNQLKTNILNTTRSFIKIFTI